MRTRSGPLLSRLTVAKKSTTSPAIVGAKPARQSLRYESSTTSTNCWIQSGRATAGLWQSRCTLTLRRPTFRLAKLRRRAITILPQRRDEIWITTAADRQPMSHAFPPARILTVQTSGSLQPSAADTSYQPNQRGTFDGKQKKRARVTFVSSHSKKLFIMRKDLNTR